MTEVKQGGPLRKEPEENAVRIFEQKLEYYLALKSELLQAIVDQENAPKNAKLAYRLRTETEV